MFRVIADNKIVGMSRSEDVATSLAMTLELELNITCKVVKGF